MSRQPPPRPDVLRAFGEFAVRSQGIVATADDLVHALGSVAVRMAQATRKLSPVNQPPRVGGRRSGPKPRPPFCAATYVSFASCPGSCPFLTDRATGRRRGCFVDANVNMRRTMTRLDASAVLISDAANRRTLIALAQLFLLDRASRNGVPDDGLGGKRHLRLHLAGDAATPEAAETYAEIARMWSERNGGKTWTFTHGWPVIAGYAWGSVSVLASVETPEALRAAMARGYAAAITIPANPGDRAFSLDGLPGISIVPCPEARQAVSARTGERVTCVTCRLCFDAAGLARRRVAIGFPVHGHQGAAAIRSIESQEAAARVVQRRLTVLKQ